MRMAYRDTGIEVKMGDHVEVKYRFLWRKGVVNYVYDPSKPSPPWGENDIGYGIKLENGQALLMMSDSKQDNSGDTILNSRVTGPGA
jgi:hypothetical protein